MRKTINVKDGQIAFGFDKISGVFLQFFRDNKDAPVYDADQSEVLTGMPLASTKLTNNTVIEFLSTQDESVREAFDDFLSTEFDEIVLGYVTDKNGYHNGYHIIKTYEDWVNFFDKVDKHFILTNSLDMLIMQR